MRYAIGYLFGLFLLAGWVLARLAFLLAKAILMLVIALFAGIVGGFAIFALFVYGSLVSGNVNGLAGIHDSWRKDLDARHAEAIAQDENRIVPLGGTSSFGRQGHPLWR